MNSKFTISVNTKPYADGDSVTTELTIDTSALDEQQVREYAAMKAVVPWQSLVRSKKVIPLTDTYVLQPVGTRGKVVLDYTAALVKAVGADMAQKAINKFGSAEKACEALKEMMSEE